MANTNIEVFPAKNIERWQKILRDGKKKYWGLLDRNSNSLHSFPLLAELPYVVQKGLRLQTIVADDFLKLQPNIPQVLFSLER